MSGEDEKDEAEIDRGTPPEDKEPDLAEVVGNVDAAATQEVAERAEPKVLCLIRGGIRTCIC